MRLPLSWLEEYVDGLPPVDVLCESLTMAGLEVEGVSAPVGEELTAALVTARIDETSAHPNADKLTLCRVDDGSGVRDIVCGASNMKAGDVVVLALPGAKFADGRKIKKSKIRGAVSEGMLCSASELGISDDHEGIMILASDVEAGQPAAPIIGLGDPIIEIAVTPNRGDCLSIRGLAREIGAVCRLGLTESFTQTPSRPSGKCSISVSIAPGAGCTAYRGLMVTGVSIGPSPAWLQARLAACGVRPVNNIVDVTNLVLFETGQPLHAFDADRLHGRTIRVESLERNAKFETLDEQERQLESGDLMICDGEGPVALAGVMGGAGSAVGETTTNIFLESAVFEPALIRSTSRRLGLISESSYRFERGVDPAMVEFALLRAGELICELAGARVAGGVAKSGELPGEGPQLEVRLDRVARILGSEVSGEEALGYLRSVGVEVQAKDSVLEASVPTHRHDVTREIDLIEEIARLHGYERFEPALPNSTMSEAKVPAHERFASEYRSRLSSLGFNEAVCLGFCSRDMNLACPGLHGSDALPVVVLNPLRSDATEMRKSLIPGLLDAYATNVRNGAEVVDLFTRGRTMSMPDGGRPPVEIEAVAGLVAGPRRSRGPGFTGSPAFWDVKAAVEAVAAAAGCGAPDLHWAPCGGRPEYHPSAAAKVSVGTADVGFAGQLHPDLADSLEVSEEIYVFEIDSPRSLEYAPRHSGLKRLARYPSSRRDVSLVVPIGLLAGDIVVAVKEMDEELLESISVFDEYTGPQLGEGRKALGFTIVYRSPEGTLTEEEITSVHDRVTESLVARFGAEVRA